MVFVEDNRQWLKQRGVHALRSLGLLGGAEWLKRHWTIANSHTDNDRFCREHPDFIPPPLAAMHDAYGMASFQSYWAGGEYFAQLIAELATAYHQAPRRILEWGCGPARIMRHLPRLLPAGTELFGADYNGESVAWCTSAFPNIKFVKNDIAPPLPFERGYFNIIYAVSVFTHLSIKQQKAWADELERLLANDGALIFTVNGDRATHLLLSHERARYEAEGVVVRDHVKEGTRCYLAYNRPDYVRRLFPDLATVAHKPGYRGEPATEQDIWVLRR